jgi:polypeptide N-acetylgalactosaminyltransferase
LARIKEKRDAVLCPTIDSIDDKNMAYHGGGDSGYGIFTWSLFFSWGSMPDRIRQKRKSHVDPYPSPTMAGGLLAASREYFFEIGGYDDEMEGNSFNSNDFDLSLSLLLPFFLIFLF